MSFTPEQLRTVDRLRQKLSALSTSLGSLQQELERANPLPTPESLQKSALLMAYNQKEAQEILSANRQFFTSAHSYPLPTFPGYTQEELLGNVMRKKLDPRAEEWIDRTVKFESPEGAGILKKAELRELWDWAGPTFNGMVKPLFEEGVFDDLYTIEERETGIEEVVTGLKRKLDQDSDDEEDEEEDEDEKMEDAVPAKKEPGVDPSLPSVPIDTLLKFVSTGAG